MEAIKEMRERIWYGEWTILIFCKQELKMHLIPPLQFKHEFSPPLPILAQYKQVMREVYTDVGGIK